MNTHMYTDTPGATGTVTCAHSYLRCFPIAQYLYMLNSLQHTTLNGYLLK